MSFIEKPNSLIGSNANTQTFHDLDQDSIRFGSETYYFFENVKITKQKEVATHKILFANSDFNEDMGYASAHITASLFFYNNVDPDSWNKVNTLRANFLNDQAPHILYLPTGELFNAKIKSISEVIDIKHLDGYKVDVEWLEELTSDQLNGVQLLSKVKTGQISSITQFIPGKIKELQSTSNLISQFNSAITSYQQYIGQGQLLLQRGQGYINSVVGKLNGLLSTLSMLEDSVVSGSYFMVKGTIDRLINQCALSRQQIIDQIRLFQQQSKAPQQSMLTYIVPSITTFSQLALVLNMSQDVLRKYNPNLGMIINPSTVIYYTKQ